MGLFSNIISNTTGGLSIKQVVSSTATTKLFEAINKFYSYLATKNSVTDNFISALTVDQDCVNDDIVTDAVLNYDFSAPDPRYSAEITADTADLILRSMKQSIAQSNSDDLDSVTGGLSITSASGKAFNFVVSTIDNRKKGLPFTPIIQTSLLCSSVHEALVYIDEQGKYMFNNLIRSANFVKEQAMRIRPSTLKGMLASAYSIKFNEYPSLDVTLMQMLHKLGLQGATLAEALSPYSEGKDILAGAAALWEETNVEYPLVKGKGVVTTVWSLLRDQMESSELNSALMAAASVLKAGVKSASDFISSLQEWASSKYNSVKTFVSKVTSVFAEYGLVAAISYVLQYAKAGATFSLQDDDTLSFADNSQFVPQVYIAGLLTTIFTVIGSILTAIVAVFSRVVGAVLAFLTSIISSFFSKVNYDYDTATKAAVTSSSDTPSVGVLPIGGFKATLGISALDSAIQSLINDGNNILLFQVPGGKILLGPAGYADDEHLSVSACNIQFYPGCEDLRGLWSVILSEIMDPEVPMYNVKNYQLVYEQGTSSLIGIGIRKMYLTSISNRISQLSETLGSDFVLVGDETTGVLTDDDDATLRSIVMANTFIFMFWALGLEHMKYYSGWPENWVENDSYMECFFRPILWKYPDTTVMYDIGTILTAADNLGGLVKYSSIPWLYQYGEFHVPSTPQLLLTTTDTDGTPSDIYFRANGLHADPMSWLTLVDGLYNKLDWSIITEGALVFSYVLGSRRLWSGVPECLGASFTPAISIPKYDRESFWAAVLITAITVTVAAGTAIAVGITAKRALTKLRAKHAYTVEQKYTKLIEADDPEESAQLYKEYRRAVFKNNFWANFIGGSKFSKVSYWDEVGSSSDDGGSSSGSFYNSVTETAVSNTGTTMSLTDATSSGNDTDNLLRKLIVGPGDLLVS